MSVYRRGQRVRIVTDGTVMKMQPKKRGPIYRVGLDLADGESDDELDRDEYWFRARDLQTIDAPTLRSDEPWRDVCADMIRFGKDREAIALLFEKAPEAALWAAWRQTLGNR